MAFLEYAQAERKLVKKLERYEYLVNKFFDGVSLAERTRIDRSLLDYCWGCVSTEIYGFRCCRISINRFIQCPYSSANKDHNGFNRCLFEPLKSIELGGLAVKIVNQSAEY